MLKRTYDDQVCSIARALELVGERWTFLIIRDALLGVSRFDAFLGSLGVARNVLTDRLNGLVDHGLMERVPYQDRPLRHGYHLTPKGRELTTVIISLMEWGDRHITDDAGPPRVAEHVDCGGSVETRLVCHACERALSSEEVETRSTRGGAPHRTREQAPAGVTPTGT